MLRRSVSCAALLCLLVLPGLARPQEESQTKAPGFVIRLQSLDDLIGNVKYVASLAGRGKDAKSIEGIFQKVAEGINTKKPIAIYGFFGPAGLDTNGVALIPITDEKAFLTLLETFNIKPEKDKEGLYTINHPLVPFPIYFRFVNQHLYATIRDQEVLDEKKLLAPAALFPPGDTSVASVTIRLDKIPDTVRQLANGQIDSELTKAKSQELPNGTEAQKALRDALIDHMGEQFIAVMKQGKELALHWTCPRKRETFPWT